MRLIHNEQTEGCSPQHQITVQIEPGTYLRLSLWGRLLQDLNLFFLHSIAGQLVWRVSGLVHFVDGVFGGCVSLFTFNPTAVGGTLLFVVPLPIEHFLSLTQLFDLTSYKLL